MNTVFHIFTANRIHLVPQIIKGFHLFVNKCRHNFILITNSQDNYEVYDKIKVDYEGIQLYYIKTLADLTEILVNKKSTILFHSLMPKLILQLILKGYVNVNVVFWGSGIHLLNFKSCILYPFKFILYHKFHSIVVLMKSDQKALETRYFLKNISCLSYIGEREILVDKIERSPIDKSKVIIYVGNNSSCLASYCYLAQNVLKRWNDKIHVEFMLNYNLTDNEELHKLQLICHDYKSVHLNTTFYDLEHYIHYMNSCTHYLCGEESQTGLGAIYTCLKLGKKIFLSGANYDWISSLGYRIFHIDDIKNMSFDEFASPLSNDEICHNIKIMKKVEDIEAKASAWNSYLCSLAV